MWTLNANSNVVSLSVLQNGQLGIEVIQVKSGGFLVQDFWQFVNAVSVLVGGDVFPEFKLGQSLVTERGWHNEWRVTGGTTQVQQTSWN